MSMPQRTLGSVVLANSCDLGAWYRGRVLLVDDRGGDVMYTVQYEAHRIDNADTESDIPESHVRPAPPVGSVVREPLPLGSVVLANSCDRGTWHKGRVVGADRVEDFSGPCWAGVAHSYTHTVEYETHHIESEGNTESGIPWSHIMEFDPHRHIFQQHLCCEARVRSTTVAAASLES
eukprot:SAG11_NODE_10762_length_807_cov_1.149718_1_plen_176_part_01